MKTIDGTDVTLTVGKVTLPVKSISYEEGEGEGDMPVSLKPLSLAPGKYEVKFSVACDWARSIFGWTLAGDKLARGEPLAGIAAAGLK